MIQLLNGFRVQTSPCIVKKRLIKMCKSKKKRIRKKWLKNDKNYSGFEPDTETVMRIGDTLIMHPKLLERIKKARRQTMSEITGSIEIRNNIKNTCPICGATPEVNVNSRGELPICTINCPEKHIQVCTNRLGPAIRKWNRICRNFFILDEHNRCFHEPVSLPVVHKELHKKCGYQPVPPGEE